ncbi:hypothetical protein, partial [Candidatus Avelusimicrobium alvi]|uniref:hypothetical protein n=1 Tax=Candidatus Avelusimicrobium alvi TaxID=3416221 RepID=UPI003D12F850
MFVIFFILAKFWRKKSSLFKVRKTGGNPVGNGPRGQMGAAVLLFYAGLSPVYKTPQGGRM